MLINSINFYCRNNIFIEKKENKSQQNQQILQNNITDSSRSYSGILRRTLFSKLSFGTRLINPKNLILNSHSEYRIKIREVTLKEINELIKQGIAYIVKEANRIIITGKNIPKKNDLYIVLDNKGINLITTVKAFKGEFSLQQNGFLIKKSPKNPNATVTLIPIPEDSRLPFVLKK